MSKEDMLFKQLSKKEALKALKTEIDKKKVCLCWLEPTTTTKFLIFV